MHHTGQTSDVTAAPHLLEGQKADAILADKAYDSNDLREQITSMMKAKAVIPSKRNRNVWDCQDFRVWAGIMGKKESHYVPTQGTGDTG